MMDTIDWSRVIEIVYWIISIIGIIGVKMKWWKKSDFAVAGEIIKSGIKAGAVHEVIASHVSEKTKFTMTQALKEVREINVEMKSDNKSKSKKLQRAGRKLLWRFFEGGL